MRIFLCISSLLEPDEDLPGPWVKDRPSGEELGGLGRSLLSAQGESEVFLRQIDVSARATLQEMKARRKIPITRRPLLAAFVSGHRQRHGRGPINTLVLRALSVTLITPPAHYRRKVRTTENTETEVADASVRETVFGLMRDRHEDGGGIGYEIVVHAGGIEVIRAEGLYWGLLARIAEGEAPDENYSVEIVEIAR